MNRIVAAESLGRRTVLWFFSRASAARRRIARRMRRHPVLAGTLLVGCGYALMNQSWVHSLEVMLVYSLGACLLALLSQHRSRGLWLFRFWNIAFMVDLGVKAFMLAVYKSPPDAPQIIEGLSNTTSGESTEFLLNYWQLIGSFTLQLSTLLGLMFYATRPAPWRISSSRKGVLAVCLAFALMHLNPAVRRANPIVFWTVQAATIEEFRANVETLHSKRTLARSQLREWAPSYHGPKQHTLGLVIGESTNRWNWQMYGYARETSPELMKQADELLIFRDVLSAASTTVTSLRHMLTPRSIGSRENDESLPSVLMLARAAGYKVFWISNQHDLYITTRFAEEADVMRLLNEGGANTGINQSRSLDERLLPAWQEALDDPAPLKLIIAHMLGGHAHYDLRSPADYAYFEDSEDDVDRELTAQGRPQWVRQKRDQYDEAMRYQDGVISQLLVRLRARVGPGNSAAWLYTADHGEEVGHTRNFAGHAPDEAGQVVPLLLWRSNPQPGPDKNTLENRAFQTDVLDWTLLDLMHIQTTRTPPDGSLLHADYHPRPRFLHDGTPYVPSELEQISRTRVAKKEQTKLASLPEWLTREEK